MQTKSLRPLLFVGATAAAVLVYLFLLSALRGKLGVMSAAVPALVLALIMLWLNHAWLRAEGRSLADVGIGGRRTPTLAVALSFAGGALTVGAWAVAVGAVTGVHWRPAPAYDGLAAAAAVAFLLFNNAAEELAYRAYLFLAVMRPYGAGVAVAATSLVFTVLHVEGGLPWLNALAGVFTSALIFAAIFVRWRSVPLALAFHVGMNVAQETLGLRPSALTVIAPAYATRPTPAQTYTLLALTATIDVAVAVLVLTVGRRRAEPDAGSAVSTEASA
jgi:membrane protease YdiL (CAAX protease family)